MKMKKIILFLLAFALSMSFANATICVVTDTIKPNLCAGKSITVGSHTYSATGTYSDTLKGAGVGSCDSIVVTELTINPAVRDSQTVALCAGKSVTVGNHTHNATGTYTDTLTTAGGCDSLIITTLTINPAVRDSQTVALCAGKSVTVGNHTHNATGTYTDTLT